MRIENKKMLGVGMLALLVIVMAMSFSVAIRDPDGPNNISVLGNTTRNVTDPLSITTNGGTITTVNVSGVIQNPRWKAFVGNVSGQFVLSNSAGQSIYDWSLINITGKIYATRKTTTVAWENISCATLGEANTENAAMNHEKPEDNLTATFDEGTHQAFYVGPTEFTADECGFAMNTYVSGADQDITFEEILLHDGTVGGNGGMVYTTILEQDSVGYDGERRDFQMIVPEDGADGATTTTTYYLYIELGN